MLFKASIDYETTKDKEKLAEQLYIFLNDFVNVRLKYEDKTTKEDCVQDTIMALLDRLDSLTEETKQSINLEQYLYNRANSYISSIWLGKLKRYRSKFIPMSYITEPFYERSLNNNFFTEEEVIAYYSIPEAELIEDNTEIDFEILNQLVEYYELERQAEVLLLQLVENKLIKIGYEGKPYEINYDSLELDLDVMKALTISVVEEYIIYIKEKK